MRYQEENEGILSAFYDKVINATKAYTSFLDFGHYLVFGADEDLKANMVDMAGNRGCFYRISDLSINLLSTEINDDLMESLKQASSVGKVGQRYLT